MGDSIFINGRAAVHKGSGGTSVASPDVCLCPPGPPAGPVPTPLVNTVVAADLDGGALTVKIEGNPAGTRDSFFRKSTGNEVARATGGGILTATVQGQARFRFGYSRNVLIEGVPAVRHGDPLTHNHAAFPGNTPPAPWTSRMDPAAPRRAPKNVVRDAGEQRRDRETWIELRLLDELGHPLEPTSYRLRTPTGKLLEGRTLRGGVLKVLNLVEGTCELTLPDADARCAVARRTATARTRGQQVGYRPSQAVRLSTGRAHDVLVPGMLSLWIDLPIDPRDFEARDDRFVLRSGDGKYDVARTIADDRVRGDAGLTIEFPALVEGGKYTLTHERGPDFAALVLFRDCPFEELYQPRPVDESLENARDEER